MDTTAFHNNVGDFFARNDEVNRFENVFDFGRSFFLTDDDGGGIFVEIDCPLTRSIMDCRPRRTTSAAAFACFAIRAY